MKRSQSGQAAVAVESHAPARITRRAGVVVMMVVALSGALTLFLFRTGGQGIYYDALNYYQLSLQIAQGGLFSFSHHTRTYGYPLFLALCGVLGVPEVRVVHVVAVSGQWLALAAASLFAARRFQQITGSPTYGAVLLGALMLNPYVLIASIEVLTDSLAATAAFSAFVFSVPTSFALNLKAPRGWLVSLVRPTGPVFRGASLVGASALAAASAMFRPSHFLFVPPLAVAWVLRRMGGERHTPLHVILAAGAVALILLPQVAAEVHAGRPASVAPPTVLYGTQVGWGLRYLKYGTSIARDREPQVYYRNPLLPESVSGPPSFGAPYFLEYTVTRGVHVLAMLDQDLPLWYAPDIRPWYRWPSTLLSAALIYTGALGTWRLLSPAIRTRRLDSLSLYAVSAVLLGAAHVTVYAPIAVESRFALPMYYIFAPAIAAELLAVGSWLGARRWRFLIRWSAWGGLALISFAFFSRWVKSQIA